MEEFVHKNLKLLEVERQAEITETERLFENTPVKELQRRGVCLLKLCICERKTGLYGRTVLKFGPYWDGKELPSHKFSSGDIAGLSLSQGSTNELLASGIVVHVHQCSISVAFDGTDDSLDFEDSAHYKLVKLANDVTYTRLKKGLGNLNNYRSGPSSHLINVLFGISESSPPMSKARDGEQFVDLVYLNENLDATQKEAVEFALHQRDLSIVHGPPGTGKTTTVIEIIRQAIEQKLKVLACAPSNIAVDNLVERLADHTSKIIRLGHPARLLPKIQKYSLDAVLSTSEETQLVKDVRSDMDKTLSKLKKCRNQGERNALRNEMKSLRQEVRQREEAATKGILKRAQVVLSTLTGLSERGPLKVLDEEHFDIVIIDECSQALEAACWLALLKAPRCVLAGDHLQLPPTIISQQAAKDGLEVTLMERLLKLHGSKVMRMLTVQYRMHQSIMTWSSQQLYEGKLTAHHSVASHLLNDLADVKETEDTVLPMLLIDTTGCDLPELKLPSEVSKGNEGEADIVAHHIDKLVNSGLSPKDIAVIAPYNLQVELLRLRLSEKYPKLEIKSVDGFQGREKEAVVMSLVRSNEKGEVGFLAEDRRINVAVTRARRHLAIVCDSETISHHAFLKSLVDYMFEHAEVRSAEQYINEGALKSEYKRPEYLDDQMDSATSRQESVQGSNNITRNTRKTNDKQPQRRDGEKTRGASNQQSQNRHQFKPPKTAEQIEEEEEEETDLRSLLTQFIEDGAKTRHIFQSTLSSRQRFLVHKIAEELGLTHESEGDGDERHITVAKQQHERHKQTDQSSLSIQQSLKTDQTSIEPDLQKIRNVTRETNESKSVISIELNSDVVVANQGVIVKQSGDAKEPLNVPNIENNDCGTTSSSIKQNVNVSLCSKCKKEVPQSNFALHEIRCKIDNSETIGTKPKTGQPSNSAKLKKKKTSKNQHNEPAEDFDALIAEATEMNTVCNFPKCKTYATVLGQNCQFCAKRFCLTHHIAEGHGCGDAAKSKARQVIIREGVLYRGSGVPDKKPDPQKKAYLQRKLDKKLSDMSDTRKMKKKEK